MATQLSGYDEMQRHQIVNDLRNRYSLVPSLHKIYSRTIFLLENQMQDIINESRGLICDIFKFNIDLYNIKNISKNEDKLEFISLVQSFKFFKKNEIEKYSIYEFLYVQKEIFCEISALFILSDYNWKNIDIQESYDLDQDA